MISSARKSESDKSTCRGKRFDVESSKSGDPCQQGSPFGGVAQLGEHHVRNVGVKGSNPSVSISKPHWSIRVRFLFFYVVRRSEPRLSAGFFVS